MADLGQQLNQLSPEQRQGLMMKAQQEANQQIMQDMVKHLGNLGPRRNLGDVQEIKCLNRISSHDLPCN